MHRIIEANWRDALPDLPDGEAALAIVDGPYNLRKAEWDKFDSWNDFRAWYAPLWAELSRVLRDNCSLYVWGTFESLAALKPDLDAMGGGWRYRQVITWDKTLESIAKRTGGSLRMYPTRTEYCLFYVRELLPALLSEARAKTSLSMNDIDLALGRTRDNDPERGTGLYRWWERGDARPSEDDYALLREVLDLPAEYPCYPFHQSRGATDLWEVSPCLRDERVKIDGETAHVAQKPLALYERIISASSDPGDLVLDPMAGTGTAAVAAKRLGRRSVCVEIDERYCEIARARITHAAQTVANRAPLAAECAERTDDTCADVSAQPSLMEV